MTTEVTAEQLYDVRIMEWTTLPRAERLKRAAQYQDVYPMARYLMQFQKYIKQGMDPLGAYLKWIWIDKGL